MKKNSILFLTLLIGVNSFAQFGPQQIITTNAANARSVYSADIDGDGDMDVISASEGDGKVAWYENIDGLGNFGIQLIITANLIGAIDLVATDLDGDGDMDVLVASKGFSPELGRVVWYENLDGLGNFSLTKVISTNTLKAVAVFAADIDGDGDMDVLSASRDDNKVAWYENLDGLGNFGIQQIITINALFTSDVFAADLDNDGDIDVLTNSPVEAEVIWFENLDGLGNFGEEKLITNNTIGIISVFAEDIDGDNDLDVLSASTVDNKVAWYENDGQGNFGAQQIITSNLEGERVVFAADLDNDGDIDVLSAYQEGLNGEVVWYENTNGNGNFSSHQVISDEVGGPRSLYAIDIDNDGDLDVLSASTVDYKIAWYENYTILSANDNTLNTIVLSPNPTNGLVTINAPNSIIVAVEVYDMLGKQIFTSNLPTNTINLSNLQTGMYLVKIITEQGSLVKKIIKE